MVCRRRCGGDGVVEDAFDEVGAGELLDTEVEGGTVAEEDSKVAASLRGSDFRTRSRI